MTAKTVILEAEEFVESLGDQFYRVKIEDAGIYPLNTGSINLPFDYTKRSIASMMIGGNSDLDLCVVQCAVGAVVAGKGNTPVTANQEFILSVGNPIDFSLRAGPVNPTGIYIDGQQISSLFAKYCVGNDKMDTVKDGVIDFNPGLDGGFGYRPTILEVLCSFDLRRLGQLPTKRPAKRYVAGANMGSQAGGVQRDLIPIFGRKHLRVFIPPFSPDLIVDIAYAEPSNAAPNGQLLEIPLDTNITTPAGGGKLFEYTPDGCHSWLSFRVERVNNGSITTFSCRTVASD